MNNRSLDELYALQWYSWTTIDPVNEFDFMVGTIIGSSISGIIFIFKTIHNSEGALDLSELPSYYDPMTPMNMTHPLDAFTELHENSPKSN